MLTCEQYLAIKNKARGCLENGELCIKSKWLIDLLNMLEEMSFRNKLLRSENNTLSQKKNDNTSSISN